MIENITTINIQAQNMGIGGSHEGFIGRYIITRRGIETLDKDYWCEDATYTICPFRSTSSQFFTRCLEMLAAQAPANIFSEMCNVERHAYYVPMLKTGRSLICLHSQMPQVSYDFFNQGTCQQGFIEQKLGTPQPFDVNNINPQETEFLAIWLSLADVSYVANIVGESFDRNSALQIVFVPIHYLSFDYCGEHFFMICYGDELLSQMTYQTLPADEALTGKKTLYSWPWISIGVLLILMLILVLTVITTCLNLWSTLQWFVLYKLVVFGIPILFIYIVAWQVFHLLGLILRYTFLFVEKLASVLWQRYYIARNFKQKRRELAQNMAGYHVNFPNISSYKIDTSCMEQRFKNMVDRIKMKRIVDMLKDFLK